MESLARTVAPLITTSWLDLGGLTISELALNEFQLIGATGVLVGLLFLCLRLVDQKNTSKNEKTAALSTQEEWDTPVS